MARRMVWNAPVRLVSSTCAQASSVMRAINPSAVTPALFTRTSTGPNAASTSENAASTAAGSRTSALTASAS